MHWKQVCIGILGIGRMAHSCFQFNGAETECGDIKTSICLDIADTKSNTMLANTATNVTLHLSHDTTTMADVDEIVYRILKEGTEIATGRIQNLVTTANNAVVLISEVQTSFSIPTGSADLVFEIENRKNGRIMTCDAPPTAFARKVTVFAIPGYLGILPPFLTLFLSILTQNVLLGLFSGVLLGATFQNHYNPIVGLLRTLDTYIPKAVADVDHAVVLLFCWTLSGLVVVVSKSGGSAGLAEVVMKRARTSQSGQLCTWLAGLTIFFDDYANALIVGNTVQPIADKLRISRAKLAFLVDGTAAPIASLAPISSWVGMELSLIQDQFRILGIDESVYLTFLKTIPMRYYSIFLIIFCAALIFTQRDFGPMLAEERRAREEDVNDKGCGVVEEEEDDDYNPDEETSTMNSLYTALPKVTPYWINAAVPIATIIVGTFVGLICDGASTISEKRAAGELNLDYSIQNIFSQSNSFRVLMWSSFLSYVVPACMYWYQGIMKPAKTLHYYIEGMKELMEPSLVLILSWTLGDVLNKILLSHWIVNSIASSIPNVLLPSMVFLLAAFISFCTGSSWSTMSVLFPIVIPLSWSATNQNYNEMLQSIASVLAGSVCGDHCSPISDTTILVSLATKCSIPVHIKTQMPYAMVVAVVSVLVGTLPTSLMSGYSEWVAIPLGVIVIMAILYGIGTPVRNFQLDSNEMLLSGCSKASITKSDNTYLIVNN